MSKDRGMILWQRQRRLDLNQGRGISPIYFGNSLRWSAFAEIYLLDACAHTTLWTRSALGIEHSRHFDRSSTERGVPGVRNRLHFRL